MSGIIDEDDFVNGVFFDGSIFEDLSDGFEGIGESFGVEIFEMGMSDLYVEVFIIKERVNFNGGLGIVGESMFGMFVSSF